MALQNVDFSNLTALFNQAKVTSGNLKVNSAGKVDSDLALRNGLNQLVQNLQQAFNGTIKQINDILNAPLLTYSLDQSLLPESLTLGNGTGVAGVQESPFFVVSLSINSSLFADLPATPGNVIWKITDSTVNTWGSVISGGGGNEVLAWFNGTNWTVIGI